VHVVGLVDAMQKDSVHVRESESWRGAGQETAPWRRRCAPGFAGGSARSSLRALLTCAYLSERGEDEMETILNSKGAVTRADLRAAVYASCTGLARREAAELVDLVLAEIAETLVSGEPVKLRGFGAFYVRSKGPRIGRNPKTKTPAPIVARRVLTFKAAPGLIARLNQSTA
jgi:integration host factor subunit alpha